MPSARTLAQALGAGRALLGAAILVVPDAITPMWVGEPGQTDAGRALARGLGARDVVIGVGTAVAASPSWVMAGAVADLADLGASAASPGLPRNGRIGTAALAGGAALLGAWLIRALD